MSKFTTILHEPRKTAGLSMNEYVLTDTIHHLSRGRWCNMSRETMSKEFGLSKRGIITVIDRLVSEGWIEKEEKGALRTTNKWEELIYASGAKNTPELVQKVHSGGAKSAPNIYIDIDSNINITEAKASYVPKAIDIVISTLKEHIKKDGYIYSNIKERMFGMHLTKNAEWKEACTSYNMSQEQLITYIMSYANSKGCWYIGKICSVQSFYYKWATLLSEMKTKSVAVPKNAKQEEEKKRQAEDFFNNL